MNSGQGLLCLHHLTSFSVHTFPKCSFQEYQIETRSFFERSEILRQGSAHRIQKQGKHWEENKQANNQGDSSYWTLWMMEKAGTIDRGRRAQWQDDRQHSQPAAEEFQLKRKSSSVHCVKLDLERMFNCHPGRLSKPNWTRLWANSKSCFKRELGLMTTRSPFWLASMWF